MKLDVNAFGIAAAVTVAILWVLCSLIVVAMPGMSMSMGGAMMHADLSGMQWDMRLTGFLSGLVIWVVVSYVTGVLLALIYNRLAGAGNA